MTGGNPPGFSHAQMNRLISHPYQGNDYLYYFLISEQENEMRQRTDFKCDTNTRKLIVDLEMKNKFHLNGNLSICFDTAYFIMEASSLRFIWASKKCLDLAGLPQQVVDDHNFFEQIVENIHPSDVYKIEDYLEFTQNPKRFPFSHILKLKHSDGSWRDIYVNIVVGTKNEDAYPEQLFGSVIDLTDSLKNRKNNKPDSSISNAYSNNELDLISSLSKREKEILQLIVKGHTDKEIGRKLNISYYTADTHRKNIINKLKVKNTACLAFLAGQMGVF